MPFFNFTSAAPKRLFFLKIHSLDLRKEENLTFNIILFVNYSSVINKISLSDPTVCSQSGRSEVGMFILSIHCMKKVRIDYFFPMISGVKGKAPWKVNLNDIRND